MEGFEQRRERVATGLEINFEIGGEGPPLLLLHGYPETHLMWNRVALELAKRFTVVASDLRGYGDSEKPPGDPSHITYSFRSMAADQVALMELLGCKKFAVAGHDRGGRTAHRICLDYPEWVTKVALIDIAPTLTMFERTDMTFAMGYYHWYFLAQAAPHPEKLIAGDPGYYLRSRLEAWSKVDAGGFEAAFPAEQVAEYERCFGTPEGIHATCEDYRASATIDLQHDLQDREDGKRIQCPVFALWGSRGLVARMYDVEETWREVSDGPVEGMSVDCGHFVPEEAPGETAKALLAFFGG